MKAVVWIITSFVGFHRWPKAPKERAYLRKQHRHVFHVKVGVPVTEDDRQVEFHDLKDHVNCVIDDWIKRDMEPKQNSSWSCEQVARIIAMRLSADFEYEDSTVEVSEDGECGATIQYSEGAELMETFHNS